jgi:hypothetical protein
MMTLLEERGEWKGERPIVNSISVQDGTKKNIGKYGKKQGVKMSAKRAKIKQEKGTQDGVQKRKKRR